MKSLITVSGQQFGPFNTIETLEDRYRCDGVDYQFSVLGEGTTIGEWVPPPPDPPAIPDVVTMRQARLALLAIGKLTDVDTAINSLPSPDKEAARIEWDYATEVKRDWPLVLMLAPALNLDSTSLDNLFITASTL